MCQSSGGPPAGQDFKMPVSVDLPSPVGPRKEGQSVPDRPAAIDTGFSEAAALVVAARATTGRSTARGAAADRASAGRIGMVASARHTAPQPTASLDVGDSCRVIR